MILKSLCVFYDVYTHVQFTKQSQGFLTPTAKLEVSEQVIIIIFFIERCDIFFR